MSDDSTASIPPSGTAAPAAASTPVEGKVTGRRIPPWLPMAGVFLAVCGAVAWLLLGSDGADAFSYKYGVGEVMADPSAFHERQLRVEGDLRQGSIKFRQDPCEWRFVLEHQDQEMPVRFPECVVPDTFRDGMGISVIVQGKIQQDGSFLANQVVPRCPSKYEMQQRQQAGEAMPHELKAPLPTDYGT